MSSDPLSSLGIGASAATSARSDVSATPVEHVIVNRPLHHILAFTRRTIDDVINDPIARREVAGYYRLSRQIERACETLELERQWNPLA